MNSQAPPDLAGLLGELAEYEDIVAGWDAGKRNIVAALRAAIEQLHGEALRRLLTALKSEPGAFAVLKGAAGDEFVYAVLRRHALLKPSLDERVEDALAGVRPMLAAHGGDVELVRVAPPSVEVRFTGACDGCAASLLTFHAGVKKAVEAACPEITSVVQVKGMGSGGGDYASPFAEADSGAWHAAVALAGLEEKKIFATTLASQNIILIRQDAAITCFSDACAHMGLTLRDGAVKDNALECAHHGFRYDLASGRCQDAPDLSLIAHAVRIVEGQVEVRL
jgi:Fe-S cluster biogenesis protein NfuA/nitrite reductase/ring-hydroxylating ferredoxin subunit